MNYDRTYCSRCVLHSNMPGISVDDAGECSICKNENKKNAKKKFKNQILTNIEFEKSLTISRNGFDCMVMLSGGKDSLYVLKELIEQKKVNFLAFTLKHPYFTDDSTENIVLIKEKYDFNHICLNYAKYDYERLYQTVFNSEKKWDEFDSQRMACHICVCLTIITAAVFALKFNIKYIMMCLDPEQIGVMNQNVKYYLNVFEEIIGLDFLYNLFDKDSIDRIKNTDEKELPILFSPYASMFRYDKDTIVRELKESGIYQGNTSLHKCKISPLLYLYSARKYGNYYSIMKIAEKVRNNQISRDDSIRFLEEYQSFMDKKDFSKDFTEEEINMIDNIVEIIYPKKTHKEEFTFEVDNIISVCEILKEYKIDEK